MQTYEKEILTILAKAGTKGLKREKIVRHVYNACNSMFQPLAYEEVYSAVSQYLYKASKISGAIVIKGGFGIYRLDERQAAARQLFLFDDENTTENTNQGTTASVLPSSDTPSNEEGTLSLFPGEE